jgi:hypothetical protein
MNGNISIGYQNGASQIAMTKSLEAVYDGYICLLVRRVFLAMLLRVLWH